MGLGDFFRKLFGGSSQSEDSAPSMQQPPDAIKDASDYVLPQPELVPEKTEPVVEKTAFATDTDEEVEDFRKNDFPPEDRVEESAD